MINSIILDFEVCISSFYTEFPFSFSDRWDKQMCRHGIVREQVNFKWEEKINVKELIYISFQLHKSSQTAQNVKQVASELQWAKSAP